MSVYSEVNSPARQLFSCCNDCSMDKALLTRMRQEEAENLITLSTKKLQEIYDFDSEYLASNNTLKNFSRNSTRSSNVLACPFECSSTSAFTVKQSDYEKIRPKDTWHWKYIDANSQYIPSFYRNKLNNLNRHISITRPENFDYLKTPSYSITDGNRSLQFELKNNKIEKKGLLNSLNSWNVPVGYIKNASSNNPRPKHNSLMQINEITLTKNTLLNQIPLNRTRNLLNNPDVSKCGKTKPYLTPEICRKESIKRSKSSSFSRKYRQMTILKILSRWHKQVEKSYSQ
ncbi:unnamed protein product [Schistosoma spindalis]|nr:unnamed protein product [Schistosoma spindale]